MQETLGVLLYENAQAMDIIGPWEVFGLWKNILQAPLDLILVSENGSFVQCVNEIVLKAHTDFNHAPQLDYLLVPGGPGRIKQCHNHELISFIKNQSSHCKYILSDCTGAFLLYQAGLLKNKSATTYWRAIEELKSSTDVQVIEDRIVKSGNIWTAGGISSGIDLAFELIAEIAGKETAGQVQLLFEYFPRDTVYCSMSTMNTLPPYATHAKISESDLPEYIKRYIQK